MDNENMSEIPREILEAYDPDRFKENAEVVIKLISNYLKEISEGSFKTVLPDISPEDMLNYWDKNFDGPDPAPFMFHNRVLDISQHIHHPNYVGHQVTAPLPQTAVDAILTSILNNSSAVYEMSPVDTILQKRVVEWMCSKIGYEESSDGVLTSGGTIGNLTALLCAREVKVPGTWKNGTNNKKLCIMASELAHYSVERAVAVMGLGTDALVKIPVDNKFKLDVAKLEGIYSQKINEGYSVIALVANAASTATGSYDDFHSLADFCETKNIWLHIDGAHGASAAISNKYKPLLNGIERADSVVWDLHKMMLMPALITGVLFKEGSNSYRTFLQEASYLFKGNPESEWFNYAHRTLECTKDMMGTKPYLSLKMYGERFFEKYIDYIYDLTKEFAQLVYESDDFKLAVQPDSNIICFRYEKGKNCSDHLQLKIREKILQSEKFYLVQTKLFDNLYLRCTIINPLTKIENLAALLDLIRKHVPDLSDY